MRWTRRGGGTGGKQVVLFSPLKSFFLQGKSLYAIKLEAPVFAQCGANNMRLHPFNAGLNGLKKKKKKKEKSCF